jgi:uncharacterized protein YutE (UPF0331/DUF86 family)
MNPIDDVVINKVQSIQRYVGRAREEYHRVGDAFRTDYTAQDAAVLNVTRACEQAIDLANHVVKVYKLGIPISSGESFELLARRNVITADLAQRMQGMVGFRNIAVHLYQKLDLDVVEKVITSGLDDVLGYADIVLAYLQERSAPTP